MKCSGNDRGRAVLAPQPPKEKHMEALLAGAVVVASLASIVPASAQRIDLGPGGPSVDLRSRGERERDYRRDEYRRDRDDRRLYRTERFDDDRRGRNERRGYGY
jgi:hypothetical protein